MGHLAKRIIENDGHSLLSVEYCNGIIDNDGRSLLNIAILKPFWTILVSLSRCKDYYILLLLFHVIVAWYMGVTPLF